MEWRVILVMGIVFVLYIVASYIEKRQLHATIDRLTNKLMAKDYREYVQLNEPVKPVREEDEKPLSWYDH